MPDSSTLFLIPARGGSKGLPGKNIRPLLGKPLIVWTIETALQAAARVNGRVVVSTDDKTIAEVALRAGAEVPFMRPAELAQDNSTSMDVVLHALNELQSTGNTFDYLCMLEATSPQREADDVIGAIHLLQHTPSAESVVGIAAAESAHPAFLALKDDNHFIRPYLGREFIFKRRQEIDTVYFFEGSMYITRVDAMLRRKTYYHDRTLGYEMPKWKSFEIDDLVDFMLIERLMLAKLQGELK